MRVLVLGGTSEARVLAAALIDRGWDVLSSLAGRVQNPRVPDGAVRVGGFGGADGLAVFLRAERFDMLVDATHPFAATISANAAIAAERIGVPRLVLQRPGWDADPTWDLVADIEAACRTVRAWSGESVFLTTGRRDLAVFAGDGRHRYLVRSVDPPAGLVPPRMTLILDRGPYTLANERALMDEHAVGLLVTKNSGGVMTAPKLEAARALGIAVVMVRRPPLPAGSVVAESVAAALDWVSSGIGAG
jgi:precorrin-6A/cobalt-precorrin-6A reductase